MPTMACDSCHKPMKPKEGMRLLKAAGFEVTHSTTHSECWKKGGTECWISKSTSGSNTLSLKTIGEIRGAIRQAEKASPVRPVFKAHQATVGTKVRSRIDFMDVPCGSTGTISEDYGTGVMVRWDSPTSPSATIDGFDKKTELRFLEKI